MTDERLGEGLFLALDRLPRSAAVIFRHYRTGPVARRALFERVRAVARRRGLVLILAGSASTAAGWRADGVHGREGLRRASRPLLRTVPAHDPQALVAARRGDADLVLVSPVFATRSHPGMLPLGPVRFGLLVHRHAGEVPVIALGGVDSRRFARLRALRAKGWAAIDALAGPRAGIRI